LHAWKAVLSADFTDSADYLWRETHPSRLCLFVDNEKHFLSHSLRLADALIAATAITCGLPLLTGNDKHYRIIKELTVKLFRPR